MQCLHPAAQTWPGPGPLQTLLPGTEDTGPPPGDPVPRCARLVSVWEGCLVRLGAHEHLDVHPLAPHLVVRQAVQNLRQGCGASCGPAGLPASLGASCCGLAAWLLPAFPPGAITADTAVLVCSGPRLCHCDHFRVHDQAGHPASQFKPAHPEPRVGADAALGDSSRAVSPV